MAAIFGSASDRRPGSRWPNSMRPVSRSQRRLRGCRHRLRMRSAKQSILRQVVLARLSLYVGCRARFRPSQTLSMASCQLLLLVGQDHPHHASKVAITGRRPRDRSHGHSNCGGLDAQTPSLSTRRCSPVGSGSADAWIRPCGKTSLTERRESAGHPPQSGMRARRSGL